MLQIKNLKITHKNDLRPLVRAFSLTFHKGDKIALIGEEGNGKSTLLKWIYNPALIAEYAECSGERITNGAVLGYLAQELDAAAKQKSVYAYCCDSPCFYDQTPGALKEIAKQLQIAVTFFYGEQLVGSLSGGEKVKLQLACLLMQRPDILLLDEPSNDIDLETLHWLERFIQSATVPVLYISHDETLLERTANGIVHLELLKRKTVPKVTVKKMGYQRYVETRLQALTHQEQVARKEREEYAKQQAVFQQIRQKVAHQQNTITRQNAHGGQLLKKKMHSIQSQQKRFEKAYETFTEIPDTEDAISLKFSNAIPVPNGKTILSFSLETLQIEDHVLSRNLSLEVNGAEKICIIGRNGTGKTTLLRQIAAQLETQCNVPVFYMPQNYADQLPLHQTPVEYLTVTGDKTELSRIGTLLGNVKYTPEEMQHPIAALSGGQKAKLFFLKMVFQPYGVLILDEPTRNLSPLSNPVIRRLLQAFPGTIISISHDRKYIETVCDTVYRLKPDGLYKVQNIEDVL